MSDEHADAAVHAEHDDSHADYNVWQVVGYLLALTFATFLTLYLPRNVWPPLVNMLFVLAIATAKATLVVGFFMHYRFEKSWKYFLTLPTCVLAVVAVLALLPDVGVGTYPKAPWVFAAENAQ